MSNSSEQKKRFLSLRWKILGGFTILFGVVFAVAFYWFYNTAEALALERIREDLVSTLEAAAVGVDVEELLALAATGQPNADGFSDDPRYVSQLDWLDEVHQIEERAWPYLYIPGSAPNEVLPIVDLLARYDPESSFLFLDPYTSRSGFIVLGLEEQTFRLVDAGPTAWATTFHDYLEERGASEATLARVDSLHDWLAQYFKPEFGIYGDQFGRWVSGYMPLVNAEGEKVGGIGMDFQADYVESVRQSIRDQVLPAFIITYGALFILVYIVSDFLTRPIVRLTAAAQRLGEGDYQQSFTGMSEGRTLDEIGRMANVFQIMANKVYQREQSLLRQVAELKIEIDESKQKSHVSEIVDTDFFRDLQSKANRMRTKRTSKEPKG